MKVIENKGILHLLLRLSVFSSFIVSLTTCGMIIYDRLFNFGYGNSLLFIFSFALGVILFFFSTAFSLTYAIISISKLWKQKTTAIYLSSALMLVHIIVALLLFLLPYVGIN